MHANPTPHAVTVVPALRCPAGRGRIDTSDPARFVRPDVFRRPSGFRPRLPQHRLRGSPVHSARHGAERLHRRLPAIRHDGPHVAAEPEPRDLRRGSDGRHLSCLRVCRGPRDPAPRFQRPAGFLRADLHARRADRQPDHRAEHLEGVPRAGRRHDDVQPPPPRLPHRLRRRTRRLQAPAPQDPQNPLG